MPLVIAGGPSVTDYDGAELAILAKSTFTFGVNNSGFIWPSDVIVALDSDWILQYHNDLKELKRPIITRDWKCLKGIKLDMIKLDMDIPDRLSGMVAARLSDALARTCKSKSYVIGMDACPGHYYNDESDCSKIVPIDTYEKMGLTNTINLGCRSKISAWPKLSHLPKPEKVKINRITRDVFIAWLRGEANKICTSA